MNKNLSKYKGVIDRSVLLNVLSRYKNINDKVSRLIEKGELIKLKRGLFITRDSIERGELSEFQIANRMYGPSYVSYFTALSHYNIIPERVSTIESATILRSKSMGLNLARFRYQQMPVNTFHIGIHNEVMNSISYLIASPTKALIDVLWTENLRNISSAASLHLYLTHDLRIDEEALSSLNLKEIEECVLAGRRKRVLKAFLRIVKRLQID